MKKFMIIMLIGVVLSTTVQAAPISDLDKDQFQQGASSLNPSPRSPFIPNTKIEENVDITSLFLQGAVVGKDLKMALVSGKVVKEGDMLARYKVEKIDLDQISLSLESSNYTVKLDNYVASNSKERTTDKQYSVEFRNANLKDALRFVAKAADLNIILPEDLAGRVTLSFERVELMEALRAILRVNEYEFALESGVIRVGKADAFAGGTDLRTESFRLKYATAKELVDKIKPLLSDKGSVISDERTNTLTVKDRDPIVINISNLVGTIDHKDKQVKIEARIVDANRNFSRSMGIKWGMMATHNTTSLTGLQGVGVSPDTDAPFNVNLGADAPTSGIGLLTGTIAGGNRLETQLTAAEQKGDIHILSKPNVMTVNNMPAKIRSGAKVYVKANSSISVGTSSGTASTGSSGLQEINTGIELTVTPQISLDEYIRMKIDAVESEADFSHTVDGIPAVLDNTASTTVLIKDGETAVIGGMYKQKTTKEKKGVPGFQHIPVVGWFFKSHSKTKTDNELMIFITPKISEE